MSVYHILTFVKKILLLNFINSFFVHMYFFEPYDFWLMPNYQYFAYSSKTTIKLQLDYSKWTITRLNSIYQFDLVVPSLLSSFYKVNICDSTQVCLYNSLQSIIMILTECATLTMSEQRTSVHHHVHILVVVAQYTAQRQPLVLWPASNECV